MLYYHYSGAGWFSSDLVSGGLYDPFLALAFAGQSVTPPPVVVPPPDLAEINVASAMPLLLVIDGQTAIATDVWEDLPRSVLISLFSWRRANPDDDLPGSQRYGWWGDTYPPIFNDRIGSRLWLLNRAKLTNQTVLKAKEYTEEALQWLIDDGVADSVSVEAERQGLDRLALGVVLVRGDKTLINIRFVDVWNYLPGA